MTNYSSSSPALTNVVFTANAATASSESGGTGGGIFNLDDSNPILTDVTFHANTSAGSGGGMSNENNSGPTLKSVTF